MMGPLYFDISLCEMLLDKFTFRNLLQHSLPSKSYISLNRSTAFLLHLPTIKIYDVHHNNINDAYFEDFMKMGLIFRAAISVVQVSILWGHQL